MSGKLFVVATPLGNLDDLSPRALATLRSVDAVACEDTRRTAKLLARYTIEVPMVSCHKFNERQRLEPIVERLAAGESVALVCDSGTPGVADPGRLLVREALERGILVCPLPGPSAVTTLLSASGLPADRYVFEGFLPHRAGERRRRLRELRDERRTVVLFEAPHRLHASLLDMQEVLGSRELVLGRELTKLHETILRGSPGELAERLGPDVRGEPGSSQARCSSVFATQRSMCWRQPAARGPFRQSRAIFGRKGLRAESLGTAKQHQRRKFLSSESFLTYCAQMQGKTR